MKKRNEYLPRAFDFCEMIFREILCFIFFTAIFVFQSSAQIDDYKTTSMDEEFTMEVARENQEVKITITFKDVSQYSRVMIEKTDELKNDFRQCAYIDLTTASAKNGAVEARDKYPRVTSALYRLRTVTKDGIERTYPPVRLPAQVK